MWTTNRFLFSTVRCPGVQLANFGFRWVPFSIFESRSGPRGHWTPARRVSGGRVRFGETAAVPVPSGNGCAAGEPPRCRPLRRADAHGSNRTRPRPTAEAEQRAEQPSVRLADCHGWAGDNHVEATDWRGAPAAGATIFGLRAHSCLLRGVSEVETVAASDARRPATTLTAARTLKAPARKPSTLCLATDLARGERVGSNCAPIRAQPDAAAAIGFLFERGGRVLWRTPPSAAGARAARGEAEPSGCEAATQRRAQRAESEERRRRAAPAARGKAQATRRRAVGAATAPGRLPERACSASDAGFIAARELPSASEHFV